METLGGANGAGNCCNANATARMTSSMWTTLLECLSMQKWWVGFRAREDHSVQTSEMWPPTSVPKKTRRTNDYRQGLRAPPRSSLPMTLRAQTGLAL